MIPITFVQSLANIDGIIKAAPFMRGIMEVVIGIGIVAAGFYSLMWGQAKEKNKLVVRMEEDLVVGDEPLPIAYHGRTSSIVVSGTDIIRPRSINPGTCDTTVNLLVYAYMISVYGDIIVIGTTIVAAGFYSLMWGKDKEKNKLLVRREEDLVVGDEPLPIAYHGRASSIVVFDINIIRPSVIGTDELFLALGWNLLEIHMNWTHLEKKRTRQRLYTIYLEELCIQSVETSSQASSDDVRIFMVTASWI
ncbi:MAK10-like protein [Tanacetum coccineum]